MVFQQVRAAEAAHRRDVIGAGEAGQGEGKKKRRMRFIRRRQGKFIRASYSSSRWPPSMCMT
jgi:hypothetical protein